jgi:hypothetical protein
VKEKLRSRNIKCETFLFYFEGAILILLTFKLLHIKSFINMLLFQHFIMAKTKSMGNEYQIVVQGTWEQIAECVRTTKEAIESSQPRASSREDEAVELENRFLRAYLVPQERESFGQYKDRVMHAFIGEGVKGKLASLLVGKKVPFNFYSTKNEGESTLKVESVTRENIYHATISASGDYADRGESIATVLKESLEQGTINHTYKTLDRLI